MTTEVPLKAASLRHALSFVAQSGFQLVKVSIYGADRYGELWVDRSRLLFAFSSPANLFGSSAIADLVCMPDPCFTISLPAVLPKFPGEPLDLDLGAILGRKPAAEPAPAPQPAPESLPVSEPPAPAAKDILQRIQAILSDMPSVETPAYTLDPLPAASPAAEPEDKIPELVDSTLSVDQIARPEKGQQSDLERKISQRRAQLLTTIRAGKTLPFAAESLDNSLVTYSYSNRQPVGLKIKVAARLRHQRAILTLVAMLIATPLVYAFFRQGQDIQANDEKQARALMRESALGMTATKPQEPFLLPAGHIENLQAPSSGETPESAYTKVQLIEMQMALTEGNRLVNAGNLRDALPIYMQTLAKYPRFLLVRLAAIKTLIGLGQADQARTLCSEGLALGPTAGEKDALQRLLDSIR